MKDVVEGVKSKRGKESLETSWRAFLFKKSCQFDLNGASDLSLICCGFMVYDERNIFPPCLLARRKRTILKLKERRPFGSYSVAGTAISFSSLPSVTLMGIIFLFGSVILGIYTLVMKFRGIAIGGFTTVILLQLIIGSTLMISLGIIGTYIARIFDEVKLRPRYIVMDKITSNDSGAKEHM